MSLADQLEKLQTLHAQGALTDDEYRAAKARLIGGQSPALPPQATPLQKFQRSSTDNWFGGVAGGLAALTEVPAWVWRILFVLTTLLHGIGLIMYVLMWIFVPLERPSLPTPTATAATSTNKAL